MKNIIFISIMLILGNSVFGQVTYGTKPFKKYTDGSPSINDTATKPFQQWGSAYSRYDSTVNGMVKISHELKLTDFGGRATASFNNYSAIIATVAKQKDIIIDGGVFEINTSYTFPAGSRLIFKNGGKLKFNAVCYIASRIIAEPTDMIFDTTNIRNYMQLQPTSCNRVSVGWFGAVADGTITGGYGDVGVGQDNKNAFETAFWCGDFVGVFYVPTHSTAKCYRFASQTNLHSTINSTFKSFHLISDEIAQVQNSAQTCSLFGDFTSGCVINAQGQRYGSIEYIGFTGKNKRPNYAYNNRSVDSVILMPFWVTAGLDTTQYTVYSAIGIDANAALFPTAHFKIKDCTITNFVVGINTSMGGNFQGDDIELTHNTILNCAYAYSIGNSQNRGIIIHNPQTESCFIAFENKKFGSRDGSVFSITQGQCLNVLNIFDIGTALGGNNNVSGMYVEASGRLGTLGNANTTANYPLVFVGCTFRFQNGGFYNSGWKTNLWDFEYAGNVTFTSCEMTNDVAYIKAKGWSGNFVFDNCSFPNITKVYVAGEGEFRRCKGNALLENYNIITDFAGDALGTQNKIYLDPNRVFIIKQNNAFGAEGVTTEKRSMVSSTLAVNGFITGLNANSYYEVVSSSVGRLRYPVGGGLGFLKVNDVVFPTMKAGIFGIGSSNERAPSWIVTAVDKTTRTVTVRLLHPYADTAMGVQIGFQYSTWYSNKKVYGTTSYLSATVTGVTNVSVLAVGDWVQTSYAAVNAYRIDSISGTTVFLDRGIPYTGVLEFFSTLTADPTGAPSQVLSGVTAPSVSASRVGAIYTDYAAFKWYIAITAGNGAADWIELVHTKSNKFTGININTPAAAIDVYGSAGTPMRLDGVQAGASTDSILTLTTTTRQVKRLSISEVVNGNTIKLSNQSVTIPSITGMTTGNVDVTVTGVVVGNTVTINPRTDITTDNVIIAGCYVSATNTVKILFYGITISTNGGVSRSFDIKVDKN